MAYSKIALYARDQPVFYQTINQLQENVREVLAAWQEEHGSEAPPNGHPWERFGRHNSPLIPKVAFRANWDALFSRQNVIISNEAVNSSIVRVSAGTYELEVSEGMGMFWPTASPVGEITDEVKLVNAFWYQPTTPPRTFYDLPKVRIFCRQRDATTTKMELTDFDFCLTLHSTA